MDKTNLQIKTKEQIWVAKIFWSIMAFQVVLWTILPVLVRYTIPNDLIEAINWAQQLSWGYDKNPWVIGWLTRLGLEISYAHSCIGYYFLQQVFIVFAFWSVWKLANKILHPWPALVAAVLLLAGCLYYSAYAQNNNDNFALIAFLNFTIYNFFMATESGKIKYVLLAGVSFALAIMTKYSALLLVPSMLLYVAAVPNARNKFAPIGLCVGILLCFLICLPNIIWLIQHDFISIRYLLSRVNIPAADFWARHLHYPKELVIRTFSNVVPCFLLLWSLLLPNRGKNIYVATLKTTKQKKKQYHYFVFLFALLPFLTILLLALILGWQLYWEWGVPFVPLWGLALIYYLKPSLTPFKIRCFLITVIILMSLVGGVYYLVNTRWQAGAGSADYPAEQIADQVTQIWHKKFHTPLRYIAGSRYTAGLIAFYAPDKPKVFVEWRSLYSANFDSAKLKKYGAVFVHTGDYGTVVVPLAADYNNINSFPAEILRAYPKLQVLPLQSFDYYRNEKTHAKTQILIGLLPPED
jgi:4-amino-4-deoxy-L-arabinose transferase-like glycosyltransferase